MQTGWHFVVQISDLGSCWTNLTAFLHIPDLQHFFLLNAFLVGFSLLVTLDAPLNYKGACLSSQASIYFCSQVFSLISGESTLSSFASKHAKWKQVESGAITFIWRKCSKAHISQVSMHLYLFVSFRSFEGAGMAVIRSSCRFTLQSLPALLRS